MTDEKLTDKKTLSVIVLVAVAILIGTVIHIDIIYGPRPKDPSTVPDWIFSYITYVGVNLAILTYWLKIGRKRETEEKFSVKKVLAIIVATVIGCIVMGAIYLTLGFFCYIIIEDFWLSWIIATSTVATIMLVCLVHTLKTRKKRESGEAEGTEVMWFDDYFGWLGRLVRAMVKKLREWIEETEK